MENIIFYAPYLVCIILLFIVASNYTKINKYRSNVQFWRESFDDVSKRIKEMTAQLSDFKTLLGIRDNSIEVFKSAINEKNITIQDQEKIIKEYFEHIECLIKTIDTRDEITTITDKKLKDQAKLIQKLTDELTIKNTTIESLTKHLQDNHKQDKTFNVLESLEDLIPRKVVKKTKNKDK